MTLRAVIVILLLAAIVVPVVIAELRRARPGGVRRTSSPKPVKPESSPKPQLRLVVNKNDMDRELAALLAQNARKPSEGDE